MSLKASDYQNDGFTGLVFAPSPDVAARIYNNLGREFPRAKFKIRTSKQFGDLLVIAIKDDRYKDDAISAVSVAIQSGGIKELEEDHETEEQAQG